MRRKSKSKRFCRIAEKRIHKLIGVLKSLRKCSSRICFEYTKEQLQEIFARLQGEVANLRSLFDNLLKDLPEFLLTEDRVCPFLDLPLPDGSVLRTSAVDDENFPAVNIHLIDKNGKNLACFAEYNPEHEKCKELSICVYQSNTDIPVYYGSYYEKEKL